MADEQKGTAYKVLIPMVDGHTDDLTSPAGEPPDPVIAGAWREVTGTWSAPNDIAAIKAAEKEHGPFEFGAVAVPARSWRPRKPQRKVQETTLWT